MTHIIFEPEYYPRTMTRAEWSRAYRWVRKTRKELKSHEEQMLAAALLGGDERIRRGVFDKIMYPPIIAIPDFELPHEVSLQPGAINYVRSAKRPWLP